MADTKELANKARTTLAQALQALQAAQDEKMMDVAEPIAATMGVLHRIEKGEAVDGPSVQQALDNVRTALDTLQTVEAQDDAVDTAMEAVAGSLSKLFSLHRALSGTPAPPAAAPRPVSAAPRPAAAQPAAAPQPAPAQPAAMGMGGTHVMSHEQAAAVQAVMPPQAAPPQHTAPVQQAAPQQAHFPAAQPQAQAVDPMEFAPTLAAQAQQQQQAPQAHAPAAHAGSLPADHHVPGMTDAPPPPTDSPYVNVELGAHSGSNFYKGLSGNDVIDHGGIFVATYQIPKIGSPVALRILLPGDLEFQADALVQWVRETRSGESQPGFGAKFTRITPEGRQLVYRYVRNREPIFYDDF